MARREQTPPKMNDEPKVALERRNGAIRAYPITAQRMLPKPKIAAKNNVPEVP